jgi:TIR domain
MATIFISYRQQNTLGSAGRIYDRLCAHFHSDAVFRDIDDTPLGVDFREYIHSAVGQSDLVVLIIGKDWAGGTALIDGSTTRQTLSGLRSKPRSNAAFL